jgi:hypothetical protein
MFFAPKNGPYVNRKQIWCKRVLRAIIYANKKKLIYYYKFLKIVFNKTIYKSTIFVHKILW